MDLEGAWPVDFSAIAVAGSLQAPRSTADNHSGAQAVGGPFLTGHGVQGQNDPSGPS